MSTVDWPGFGERSWNVCPGRVPAAGIPVDVESAYAAIVGAAQPFRAGIRFGALPDVQFFVDGGQLRAPGPLLPGIEDATLAHYSSRLGGRAFALVVKQPLMTDFQLWSQVRDLVVPLWRQVGVPSLPVATELVLAQGIAHAEESSSVRTHAALSWVLRGSVKVDLGDGDTLSGGAGDLLYPPAGYRPTTTYVGDCLVLRLSVATDARLAALLVRDVLADLVQRQRGADTVPYLPYPPRRDQRDCLPAIDELVDIRARLIQADLFAEAERRLCIQWVRRASAAALEPVPPPREPCDITAEHRFRECAEIVRAYARDGEWIWAVNGHAFSVAGRAADDVLARLRTGEAVNAADLCGGPPTGTMGALLSKLYRVRGVELAA